tara:strand:- start:2213 stop:2602 length:390 start_codon:yes stop_codon:yes gene_type:complete
MADKIKYRIASVSLSEIKYRVKSGSYVSKRLAIALQRKLQYDVGLPVFEFDSTTSGHGQGEGDDNYGDLDLSGTEVMPIVVNINGQLVNMSVKKQDYDEHDDKFGFKPFPEGYKKLSENNYEHNEKRLI